MCSHLGLLTESSTVETLDYL